MYNQLAIATTTPTSCTSLSQVVFRSHFMPLSSQRPCLWPLSDQCQRRKRAPCSIALVFGSPRATTGIMLDRGFSCNALRARCFTCMCSTKRVKGRSHTVKNKVWRNESACTHTNPMQPASHRGSHTRTEVGSACTASCGWHMRCIVVRGDAWPLLLSPCNTHAQTRHRLTTQPALPLTAPHTHVSLRHQHWHCKARIITQP